MVQRGQNGQQVSLRVSSQGYIAALLIFSFYSAFLFYIGLDLYGSVLFATSWIILPLLALQDRVVFDGTSMRRSGQLPRIWNSVTGSPTCLRLRDVEMVETGSLRTIQSGGHVFYRYRTEFRGKGWNVAISSGGPEYRQFIQLVLRKLPADVLDSRSIELRDHLSDPDATMIKAEASRIPSAEVLTPGVLISRGTRSAPAAQTPPSGSAEELRTLGNELKLSGHLIRALEAFRRALRIKPDDAVLLFDFSKCLYSLAGATKDSKLERRAIAAARLSKLRAGDNEELLIRLGEWYFQIGEWHRASSLLKEILNRFGTSFRSARAMAEIALHEGKLAHVVHQFITAAQLADTPSLRRWSRTEAAYFSRLNDDDEYLDREVGRVGLLETAERSKRTALWITFIGLVPILIGVLFDATPTANVGWAISSIALTGWIILIICTRRFSKRNALNKKSP